MDSFRLKELIRKKDLIMNHEGAFANDVGRAVFDKPRISFWMIMLPILFLHFIYLMQKYKNGRLKFNTDFMSTRRGAMDTAIKAATTGGAPDCDELVKNSGLADGLKKPYSAWIETLVGYYMDLLAAKGDSFDALVRSAYRNRTGYLLIINRLNTVEREFYSALEPHLADTAGAAAVIAKIEYQTQQLRREAAEKIFS